MLMAVLNAGIIISLSVCIPSRKNAKLTALLIIPDYQNL